MQKRMNEPDLEKRQMVLDMRLSGMTYKEIANAMGYKGDAWVCKVCRESGLGGTSSWKTKKYNEYRDYIVFSHCTVFRIVTGYSPVSVLGTFLWQ